MLIFPYKYQGIKAILLFLLLLSPFFQRKETIVVSKKLLIWGYVYVFSNLFSICYGVFLSNPAPYVYVLIYCLWPLIFVYLTLLISKSYFYSLISCMRYCLFVILIMGIFAFLMFNLTLMKEGEILGYDATIRPGFPFIAISGGAVTSVIFLYFFFFSLFLVTRKLVKLDWINITLGVFYIFFTSRRVIFLNFFLAFFFVFLLIRFLNQNKRTELITVYKKKVCFMFFILSIIVVFSLFYGLVDFEAIGDFLDNTIGNDNNDPRIAQFESLIAGWVEKPLLGNGTGVNASVIRSDIPGTYELSYIAMLFERGIIGMLIFVTQYLILMFWSIQGLKKSIVECRYVLSLIVAVNLFMIANATNPYLGAFDHIWFLFLPIVIINLSKDNKNENLCLNKSL